MQANTLFLLDAYALIYRAHFALSQNPRISANGINTGAVMGFTNSLLEIITKERPSHLAVAFDTPKLTFRSEIFPEYKAHRESTPEEIKIAIPYCKKIVEGFNIPVIELDGYEADDIIGTIAKQASKSGLNVRMMTPDKDFAQLVDERVWLYKPARMGKGVETLKIADVLEKFDLNRVDQVRDFLGLKGDAVDNIPGVNGIGDKTASKLLKEFDTVENILENTDKLKGAVQRRLIENGHLGLLSKELATIKTDVPIDFDLKEMTYSGPDKEKLNFLFQELDFRTIAKRVLVDNVASPAPAAQMGLFDSAPPPADFLGNNLKTIAEIPHQYHLVDTEEKINHLVKLLQQQKEFCFDTETTSLNTRECQLVGISFAIKPLEAWYVPCFHNSHIQFFKGILEDTTIRKIGQNLKYDIQVLRNESIRVKGKLFDTMLAHFLIDSETNNSMDVLAEKYLQYQPISYQSLVGNNKKNQKTIDEVALDKVVEYACEDADITLQLKIVLQEKIHAQQLEKLLHDIEEPLSFVLADMEYIGVSINTEALHKMSAELGKDSLRLQTEIHEIANDEFNINSPKQLGQILFDKLRLVEKPKKTKTGQYATGEEILSSLAKEHDIASKILEFRECQKLKSTYVDALPKLISPIDHRIHTDYRQTVASTGRLSSNNPNLQNIPIQTERGREIRKAFVPSEKGYLIMSADYSQIELRVMAAFSQDQEMMKAFHKGRDIHTTTATKIFGVSIDEVTPLMRRKAKEVNFGIIYGMSAFGLSQNLSIPRSEAQEIINSYFNEFVGVKKYIDTSIAKAQKEEYVETILGRRRYLRNINSKNFTMRGFDERNAINAPIQGSAADIIKVAMIEIHRWMYEEGLKSKMIMQVHDELVFEMAIDEEEVLKKQVEYFMKNASPLDVPMEVNMGVGNNWLESH